MIKAIDLRIGNIVYGVNNRLETVVGLSQQVAYVFVGKIPETFRECLENINPIPLTEEWLIKFGFNNQPRGFEINNGNWTMVLNSNIDIQGDEFWHMRDYSWHTHGFVGRIYYVHQLQNLYFALVGEELL